MTILFQLNLIKEKSIVKTYEIQLTVTKNDDALSGAVSGLCLKSSDKSVDLECTALTTTINAQANVSTITCTPKDEMKNIGELL